MSSDGANANGITPSTSTSSTGESKLFAGVMIVKDGNILLGKKKRGFGLGKWQHTFAGKAEPEDEGRTEATAARELAEEIGLAVGEEDLSLVAVLRYTFGEALGLKAMEVRVYSAECERFAGVPRESEEIAEPRWFDAGSLPLDEMWSDNALWLPEVLDGAWPPGKTLHASFHYPTLGEAVLQTKHAKELMNKQ